MKGIQMVDLKGQYIKIKSEIDTAIQDVIDHTAFINGSAVKVFKSALEEYLDGAHVIPCANGTDALQIAMMALNLKPGDEVITADFTYVATAEVIGLLGLKPVLVDVKPDTFTIDPELVVKAITPKTRAIVPVHLFGQCADMETLYAIAEAHKLFIIEDNAQALGAEFTFSSGLVKKAGTIGKIGCTSFFPSKNLGCYGDGGALYTQDQDLATAIQMIAHHGQRIQYIHDVLGVNSRLDTIQAAILHIKLKHLDAYNIARQKAAAFYDQAFSGISGIEIPKRNPQSTHVFHQYTLKVPALKRDIIREELKQLGIPSMIYYPIPLHQQKAYLQTDVTDLQFPVTLDLCKRVLALPIHTEMTFEMLEYISTNLINCLKKHN